jgi:hypothetical protein
VLLLAILGSAVLFAGVVAIRRAAVSEITDASSIASANAARDLLTLDVLVFEPASMAQQRRGLRSRIYGDDGALVGTVGSARDGLGVYGVDGRKLIEVRTTSRKQAIDVLDGHGRTVGSIIPRDRKRETFALRIRPFHYAGRLEHRRARERGIAWYASVIEKPAFERGRIIYPSNRAAAYRLLGIDTSGSSAWRRFVNMIAPPGSYVLTISGQVKGALQLLMLASAAALDELDLAPKHD